MKKIIYLFIILIIIASMSQIPVSAQTTTYLDGETTRIEEFIEKLPSQKPFDTKSIYKKNGEIFKETYTFIENPYSSIDASFKDYISELESNGWVNKKLSQAANDSIGWEEFSLDKGDYNLLITMYDNKQTDVTFTNVKKANEPGEETQTTYDVDELMPCGYGLIHTISDKTLTISGSGLMHSFHTPEAIPWHNQEITTVILGKDVYNIGMNAFDDMSTLVRVDINNVNIDFGLSPFSNCENLKEIHFSGTKEQWNKISESYSEVFSDVVIYFGDGTKEGQTDDEKEAQAVTKQIRMTIGSKKAMAFGKEFTMDVAPQIINERTMLPARYVTENLGGTIEWIEEHRIVAITKDSITFLFRIGSSSAVLLATYEDYDEDLMDLYDQKAYELASATEGIEAENDEFIESDYMDYKFMTDDFYGWCDTSSTEFLLDSAPVIIEGRTFMPVRFVATFLDAKVLWDGATQTVKLEKQ